MFANKNYKDPTIVYNPIKIYVVVHDNFEDTNVFFTDFNTALKRVKKYAIDTETNLDEWRIRTFIEGYPFNGCFD